MYRYIYLYIIIYIYIIARACERMCACTCVCVCARELCKHFKVSLGDVMLLKFLSEPFYCRRLKMCAVGRILLV